MNKHEVDKALEDGVRNGVFEVAEENDKPGQTRYKLTDYGSVEAQRTISENGLPFMLMLHASHAIKQGKETTVNEMTIEILKDFPNELRRKAKENFKNFLDAYGGCSAEQYFEECRKAGL